MVVEYMDRALVPTWTFLLETFLRPYPEAQTIVEPAVVSNLLTFFRFICARDERFSGFFRFAGVVLVALVLLALRALLFVVLGCLAFGLCVPLGVVTGSSRMS